VIAALCLVFLVSGAAALMFETLWFRQAGLALGNTVWASALVTASFMAGLALGNAAVARWGWRSRRPLLAYAGLELLVGATGVSLVVIFPLVGVALAPLMGSLGGGALNALRVIVSFLLLLVPSCAMGATLPLLTGALSAHDPNFGRVLGRLYGWNTLGAFLGTLAGDLVLIEACGLRGTALVAAGLNVAAAVSATALSRRWVALTPREGRVLPSALGPRAWRVLAAAFLSGGALLALEVVWFRFMIAYTPSSAWTFAVMLAVVLLGIGGGGLLASALFGRFSEAHRRAAMPALLAGFGVVVTYASFLQVAPASGEAALTTLAGHFRLAVPLMLPVCLLSGALFTLLGRALYAELGESIRSAGLLTFANTIGAMAGALLGGFVLVPALGVERSLFGLAALYGVVGLLALAPADRRERPGLGLAAAALVAGLAVFPFGLMEGKYVPGIAARWASNGFRLIAFEEGLTETVVILRREIFARPVEHRLVTNGMSMSGTNYAARRYMGLYAWWPVAVHPGPRRALLISYGLGTTARALVETKELERIDVVDTSADVLRLSALAQEDAAHNPLVDPRVHTHVEDGRFYLLTTPRSYDIITSEPPPPKAAGIASLYSREYFALARARLAPGGILTYWLPVYQMTPDEARAVTGGFCAVFEDCSLWTGCGLEWMLVGTRGARGPVSEERFEAQWRDPVVARRLLEAGIEEPSQLGALFLADAPALLAFVADTPPLDDDHPYRLSPRVDEDSSGDEFTRMMQIEAPLRRFLESDLIARLWPRSMREPTRQAFFAQDALNASLLGPRDPADSGLINLDRLLTRTNLHAPVLWLTGTSVAEVRLAADAVAHGQPSPMADELLGLDALARREFRDAEGRLALAEPDASHASQIRMWRVLALGLAGDTDGARRLLEDASRWARAPGADPAPWRWLAERFALPDPTRPDPPQDRSRLRSVPPRPRPSAAGGSASTG
jgi:spermidine synthase